MKKEEANKLIALSKNIEHISNLMRELLTPIKEIVDKNKCTTQEACNIKIQAEEQLTQYGVFTLNAVNNTIKQMTKVITERH